jgi:tetratricopeptide (TPR) repeat protein
MMRMRITVGVAGLLLLLASPLAAQRRNLRLVASEPGRYTIALCPLRYSGKVSDAQKHLKTGIEDKDAGKRAEALDKGLQAAFDAISGGESGNPAAWYVLGRIYLAQGDVAGADSAFTRAETLQPDCEIDINQYRQNAWADIANAGLEKQRAGESDSALALFRDASTIFRGLPHVFENMGVMFANASQTDSAAAYFRKALEVAEPDTTLTENRNSAALNLSLMLQRLGRHQEAVQMLRQYLAWNPSETDARRSIAYSFRELGLTDSADAIEQELVGEFSRMNLDSLSFTDLMAVGVSQFNADQFEQAAGVFERLLARNGWSRDAVYNLANAYLALKDWNRLLPAGRKLLQIEPLNEDAHRLLGQAYRGLDQQDSLVAIATRLVMLPVNVEVTGFALSSQAARWTAVATGRAAMDAAGKPIPPAPVAVTVEFLDEAGQVVATREIAIPALAADASQELQTEVRAEGIASWRYRRAG